MRRSTLIFVLLFAVAAVIYIALNNRTGPETENDILPTPEPTQEISFLFDAADGVPAGIRIEAKSGEIVEVARGADNLWAVILPVEAPADQGMAEAAASQVTTMLVQDRVQNVALEAMGLTDPSYVLTVKFSSGVERKAEVGVITPSESGYYIRNEAGETLIVGTYAVDALLGLLTNPPYAPSPVPSTLEVVPVESATPQP